MSFFISFYRKKLYFDKLVKHLNQIFVNLEGKYALLLNIIGQNVKIPAIVQSTKTPVGVL